MERMLDLHQEMTLNAQMQNNEELHTLRAMPSCTVFFDPLIDVDDNAQACSGAPAIAKACCRWPWSKKPRRAFAFHAVFPDEELVDQRSVIIQFDGDPAADDEKLSKLTEDERLRFTGLLLFLRCPFWGAA